MTASKNDENITGQVLSSIGHCAIQFCTTRKPNHFTKMWTFSLRSILLASTECLKSVKSLKNEEFQEAENQDFEN